MAASGDRLLGVAVWYGARWYLRRRLRHARRALRVARVIPPAALVALAVARAIARRRTA
jgi:hypothetical protein